MSWNGSDNKVKSNHSSTSDLQPSTLRKHGLLAPLLGHRFATRLRLGGYGLIIVALGGAAVWWFAGRTPPDSNIQTSKHSNISPIAEVMPTTNAPAKKVVKQVEDDDPHGMPKRVGETKNGYIMLLGGRLHKVHGVTKPSAQRKTLAQRTFKHYSDVCLAGMLTAVPGGLMVGDSSMYYKNFDKQFKASLKEPITIEKDDSDEVRELKEGVIELRKEMKARMDAGEDPVAIMRAARDELQQVSIYRRDLEKQVDTAMREGKDLTEKDLEDLVGAANKMLETRGAQPIQFNKALKYRLKAYQRKARKAAQEKTDKVEP